MAITKIAGADSTEGGYADAAAWTLDAGVEGTRLSDAARNELPGIKGKLVAIELKRPQWTELLCLRAEIDLLEGRRKEAIGRFRQALETRPSDRDVAGRLAVLLMESGQFTEADQVLSGLDPADVQRLGRIAADLRLRSGKLAEALAIAEKTVESGTDDPDDFLWLAEMLAQNGRPAQACAALERGAAIAPDRIDLWLALADQRATAGDSRTACATLEDVVEQVPDGQRPLVRAEIDRHAGRGDAAVEAYRALLAGPAVDTLLMRRAAECFRVAGLTADARKTLDSLLQIRARTTADQDAIRWARRQIAELGLRDGTFAAANESLQTLRENSAGKGTMTPEDADFASRLLAARPEPRSWRIALELLESLREQQALTVSQSVLAARLRGRVDDWRRAREDLKAVALQPDMPAEVYAAYVDLLLAHDDPKTAARWIDELVSRAPTSPETIALQIRLAQAQGDKPAAVAAAKRLMPEGDVTAATVAGALATARTMEEFGFVQAADNLLVRSAAVADDGIVARIAFLLRRNRVDEAAELLEFSRTSLARRPAFTLLEAGLAEKRDRMQDAEEIYRRLIDTADVPDDQRRQATVRLALCLVDRNKAQDAYTLADRAVLEWGPHPDLLDARGVASIATGNTAGAIRDLSEAVLAPTPERRLHLAFAKMLTDALAEARDVIQAAAKSGLQMESLRPTDRERLDTLTRRLGLALR